MSVRIALSAATVLLSDSAVAHGVAESSVEARLPELLSGLFLAALWLGYCIGAWRIPPAKDRRLLFHGACLTAVLVMFETLDDRFEVGSAMHMIQHMLIINILAPIFVISRPLPQWIAASGRTCVRLWTPLLLLSRYPLWTGGLQSIVIWFWHTPKFYNLALANSCWHLAEHVSFAFGAGLFWWTVLYRRSAAVLPVLLFTLMHTGMLGALLAFAQIPLYDDSVDIQDQQLAGLIMWVPGALPYLIAGGWCSLRIFNAENVPPSSD